jgi:hypothetical protein
MRFVALSLCHEEDNQPTTSTRYSKFDVAVLVELAQSIVFGAK